MTISDINVHVLRDGKFKLLSNVLYDMEDKTIIVYSGFVWDGASIPRSLWSTVGCPSDYLYESLLHDVLYASCIYDRKTSDKMFHKALIAMGIDIVTAKAMYIAVRLGGEHSYGIRNKADAREYVSVEWKH